jgi:hypothetical protein
MTALSRLRTCSPWGSPVFVAARCGPRCPARDRDRHRLRGRRARRLGLQPGGAAKRDRPSREEPAHRAPGREPGGRRRDPAARGGGDDLAPARGAARSRDQQGHRRGVPQRSRTHPQHGRHLHPGRESRAAGNARRRGRRGTLVQRRHRAVPDHGARRGGGSPARRHSSWRALLPRTRPSIRRRWSPIPQPNASSASAARRPRSTNGPPTRPCPHWCPGWHRSPTTADPGSVKVSRPSDALVARSAVQSAHNGLFLGLGAVALLVGMIGIANVMVIGVLERRSEIGLRRAPGAGRPHIRRSGDSSSPSRYCRPPRAESRACSSARRSRAATPSAAAGTPSYRPERSSGVSPPAWSPAPSRVCTRLPGQHGCHPPEALRAPG